MVTLEGKAQQYMLLGVGMWFGSCRQVLRGFESPAAAL
jgi:hypothetical protein